MSRLRRSGAKPPAVRSGAAALQIATAEEWARLASRPGHHSVARTETVKLVVDRAENDRVYFVDTHRFQLHYDFVVRYLDPRAVFDVFHVEEYTRDDRRFVLASIMHYLDGDHWTIELAGGDSLPPELIEWMYDTVAPKLAVTKQLKLRPVSELHLRNLAGLDARIPTLDIDEIHKDLVYQPIVLGTAFGTLRVLAGGYELTDFRPYDIVVLPDVPDQLPPVSALITSQFQAPLAHVAVLSRNRNSPDMALRDATSRNEITALNGQMVKLVVNGQDFTLESADPVEAAAALAAMRPTGGQVPKADLAPTDLTDISALTDQSVSTAGTKATQLMQLGKVPGVRTPGGFVIPFCAYATHFATSGADQLVDSLLTQRDGGDVEQRHAALREIRSAITQHPLADAVLDEALSRMLRIGGPHICRSSTNAEDLAGFNGAGLYDSIVVDQPSRETLGAALREVWASVWLTRAFEERSWFQIDHRAVAMAVVVQPLVADAVASGVAITANPFNEQVEAVYINVQGVGASVTGATTNQLPEQWLALTSEPVLDPPERLGKSSLAGGASVLEPDAVEALSKQLRTIHQALLPHHRDANAMDVEFIIDGSGAVSFVQARPYTVVYDGDRAAAPAQHSRAARLFLKVRRIIFRFRR